MIRPTLSVIIPTYKRFDMLRRCLRAVRNSAWPFSQIIVTVRPDEDAETHSWLAGQMTILPHLLVIPMHHPGAIPALNAGLDQATGELIAIIDDDVLIHEDWAEKLIPHFEHQDVAAAGGRDLVYQDGILVDGHSAHPGERSFFGLLYSGHHLAAGSPRPVEAVKSANMIVRRSALGTLRFDPRLLGRGAPYRLESWLCANFRHANWRIILDPSASVDHFVAPRPDFSRTNISSRRFYEESANTVATDLAFAKRRTIPLYCAYHLAIGTPICPGIAQLAKGMVTTPQRTVSAFWGGWRGFLFGLFRLKKTLARNPPGEPNPVPISTATIPAA